MGSRDRVPAAARPATVIAGPCAFAVRCRARTRAWRGARGPGKGGDGARAGRREAWREFSSAAEGWVAAREGEAGVGSRGRGAQDKPLALACSLVSGGRVVVVVMLRATMGDGSG